MMLWQSPQRSCSLSQLLCACGLSESLLHPRRTMGGCTDRTDTRLFAPTSPACRSVRTTLLSSAEPVARGFPGPHFQG